MPGIRMPDIRGGGAQRTGDGIKAIERKIEDQTPPATSRHTPHPNKKPPAPSSGARRFLFIPEAFY
jgi:hypothetical protein